MYDPDERIHPPKDGYLSRSHEEAPVRQVHVEAPELYILGPHGAKPVPEPEGETQDAEATRDLLQTAEGPVDLTATKALLEDLLDWGAQPAADWWAGKPYELRRRVAAAQEVAADPDPGVSGKPMAQTRALRLTPASTIPIRPVRWAWLHRLPCGAISLLAGREGIGKSTVGYTIGAAITRGTLDGIYSGTPRSVIVAATEDSWEHTIVPRLMAAGADLDRVFRVDVVEPDGLEGSLSLPRDLAALEAAIDEHDVAMVLLDPLLSRIDERLDTHKDAEVRPPEWRTRHGRQLWRFGRRLFYCSVKVGRCVGLPEDRKVRFLRQTARTQWTVKAAPGRVWTEHGLRS